MFERPPSQREWTSWLVVAFWAGVIFATIPVARALQRFVTEAWGADAFLYSVAFAIVAAFAWAVRQLRRRRQMSLVRWVWFVGVAGFYAVYTYRLRHNPVEAVHFVQYGVLGLLAFRAFTHRMRDLSIYLSAALVGGIVGLLDEAIQWATPGRVWDLRDVWFNLVGATGVQIAIAAGIQPELITRRFTAAGVRMVCRIAIAAVLLLGASLLNTPSRIEWYAQRVPGLGFLLASSDVMLEYGHLYDIAGVGRFRSRFSPKELARIDAERGAEVGRILADASDEDDEYAEFLAQHTPITDPFVHEARVHLFRRDRYLLTAEWYPDDLAHRRADLTVGYRENQILAHYFSNSLRHSGRALTPEKLAYLEELQVAKQRYESRVSRSLVTSINERHVVAIGTVLLALLGVAGWTAGRRAERMGHTPC